ncbi:hypothetical protein Q5H92_24705 [Hymenobacter sp. M29]|uniref:Uncharacterized protein n=1 Tax=Hymenobacter mellowenesis TaxID=3063995 RepID=A0ABT9AIB3_9BACT|nr:hypothetical protein [Hymenobacter sp. M29]MDO7849586.1 hypothetical protein [Hymenobacter sp. M29]
MTNETLFKILAVVSPFAASGITYFLALRSKKNEYLYQNRLPAFKEVAAVFAKIRKYCIGRMAIEVGAEFSPFYGEDGSALELREQLAEVRQLNEVFLTDKSKSVLESVDERLAMLCHIELQAASIVQLPEPSEYASDTLTGWSDLLNVVEDALKVLYKEIGLPSK